MYISSILLAVYSGATSQASIHPLFDIKERSIGVPSIEMLTAPVEICELWYRSSAFDEFCETEYISSVLLLAVYSGAISHVSICTLLKERVNRTSSVDRDVEI